MFWAKMFQGHVYWVFPNIFLNTFQPLYKQILISLITFPVYVTLNIIFSIDLKSQKVPGIKSMPYFNVFTINSMLNNVAIDIFAMLIFVVLRNDASLLSQEHQY